MKCPRLYLFAAVLLGGTPVPGCVIDGEESHVEAVEAEDPALVREDEGDHVDLTPDLSLAVAPPPQLAGPAQIPLVTFYSPSRGDYFTTTQPWWTCRYFRTCTEPPHLDYQAIGLQGHVYNPDNPQPAGTVPLYQWWSANHGDNFVTTNPAWAGNIGDTRWEGGANYVLFRIEGYVRNTSGSGSFPLTSYWSSAVADNAAVAAWRSGVPAGYGSYRTEGFLLPPQASALQECQSGATPNHTDAPSWQARGNYIDTWPQPMNFLNGDAIQLTAPADWYRIDFWGAMKPVRGEVGSSAPPGFPAPGEPKYALLGRVTSGRIFVTGRGWYEAFSWFKALGNDSNLPGPCVLYDATGVAAGDLQVGYNDDNVGDNGGGTHVTVKQWW